MPDGFISKKRKHKERVGVKCKGKPSLPSQSSNPTLIRVLRFLLWDSFQLELYKTQNLLYLRPEVLFAQR